MNDTTIDTLIERLESHIEFYHKSLSMTVKFIALPGNIQDYHYAAEALRTLTIERDEQNRLYKGALRNVQVGVAHAANLNAQLESYQEKAQALHRYLGDKNVDGIEAVITEFSLMAENKRAIDDTNRTS